MTGIVARTGLLTALSALAAYALLMVLGPDWGAYAPATCRTTHCFCELPRFGQLILQPANSWSSFAFVAVGWLAIYSEDRHSAFGGVARHWFGATAILIGVGSFLLHATLTLWGQFLDVFGMYLFGAFALAWALRRWLGLRDGASLILYAILVSALTGCLIIVPETRRWLFAVVLLTVIVAELGLARPRRIGVAAHWFGVGIALQASAFAIWIADQQGTMCSPTSVWQGHAAWHVLNAGALWCNWRYYLSERLA